MHGPSQAAGPPALDEWRAGWLLVLSGLVAYGSAAVYTYIIGIFIAPLQTEFGWSRGAITSGIMISATLTAIGAPFVGRMIDVYGSRRIGIAGMAIYSFAIAMLGTTTGVLWHWWSLWVLIACGSVFVKPTVWIAAISRAFATSRGLAIAVTMTGAGVFAAITPTAAMLLIDAFGWRAAYLIIGAGLAALNLPLLYLFFGRVRASAKAAAAIPAATLPGLPVRQAMRSRQFVQLGIIAFLVTGAMVGVQIHFVPILTWQGLGRLEAAAAAGFLGIGAIIGRLITGFLLDRLHGPFVGVAAFSLPILASLLLLLGGNANVLVVGSVSAFIYGSALGAELDILAYLSGRYFGMKNYGTLFGTLIALVALAAGAGPTTAGLIYDHSGGYGAYLWTAVVAFALGMVAVGTMGPYPERYDADEPLAT